MNSQFDTRNQSLGKDPSREIDPGWSDIGLGSETAPDIAQAILDSLDSIMQNEKLSSDQKDLEVKKLKKKLEVRKNLLSGIAKSNKKESVPLKKALSLIREFEGKDSFEPKSWTELTKEVRKSIQDLKQS